MVGQNYKQGRGGMKSSIGLNLLLSYLLNLLIKPPKLFYFFQSCPFSRSAKIGNTGKQQWPSHSLQKNSTNKMVIGIPECN